MISTQRSTEAEEMYKKNEWMIAEKKDNYIIALLHLNATAEEEDKSSNNARDKEPR